jgi:hypothetical protein
VLFYLFLFAGDVLSVYALLVLFYIASVLALVFGLAAVAFAFGFFIERRDAGLLGEDGDDDCVLVVDAGEIVLGEHIHLYYNLRLKSRNGDII